MSETATRTPIPRPGGRSARVTAAVHDAVDALLTEMPREAITVPLVAERAGVNPTTIYRRWGDLQGVLADAAVRELVETGELPDTGAVRGDLIVFTERMHRRLARTETAEHVRSIVAASGAREGRSQCLAVFEAQAQEIVGRAERRGEAAPTPSQAIDHLVAPMYFRAMFDVGDAGLAPAEQLVDELLRTL